MAVVALTPWTQVPEGAVAAAPGTGELLDLFRVRQGESLLVVAGDRDGLEAARGARLALGADDVGLVLCDVPPTLSFLTLAALTRLPADALALAPAVVRAVAMVTSTWAVLPSVAGLRRPQPSVVLDAASYLPRTTFVVDWSAQTVRTGGAPEVPDAAALVVTRSERPAVAVDESAWPAARVDLESDGTFWGARRWLEVSALTTSLDDVMAWVLGPDVVAQCSACPVCGRLVGGELCVFCQVVIPAPQTETLLGGHV